MKKKTFKDNRFLNNFYFKFGNCIVNIEFIIHIFHIYIV